MKREFLLIIVLLFLQGFTTVSDVWESVPGSISNARALYLTPVITPTPIAIVTRFAATDVPTSTPLPPVVATSEPTEIVEEQSPAIERVLIISFDGMRPDAIAAAPMPNLMALMERGAYTLSARTISYPTTLPSHTSMLSGLCMEKHKIMFNSRALFRGYSRGEDLFDLTSEAGLKSVMIVGKDKLDQIPTPDTVDIFEVYWGEALIADAAVNYISQDFGLMFLHFPTADIRGHKYGWMSVAQFKALREGDDALGEVLAALEENGMLETTLIIATADHGGHDKTHDGTKIEDYIIPWIAAGPGIVQTEITNSVKIMDTAATAAYALDLPIPPNWDGIPIVEAFGIPPQDVHYRSAPCE